MTESPNFAQVRGAKPSSGLALRVPEGDGYRYLRITHVFDDEVYGLWYTTPQAARCAPRPQCVPEFEKLASMPGASLGRVSLPTELTRPLEKKEKEELEAVWALIAPLVMAMKAHSNVRNRYTELVRERARLRNQPFMSVWRRLIRFYYFGGDMRGLLSLRPGPSPEQNCYRNKKQQKRRGPKSKAMEREFGPNEFIVSPEDVRAMGEAMQAVLRAGPATMAEGYQYYLSHQFKAAHPGLYRKMMREEVPPPVTDNQFADYIRQLRPGFPRELLKNFLRARLGETAYASLRAFGPGSAYEIDATGLRVVAVAAGEPVELGEPWLYLVIDRFSRYIPAVYVTLRDPSLREVKYVLLVMLTSRDRFRALKIDVADEEWPLGRSPAAIYIDRGADFRSDGFEEAVAKDLQVEVILLPPLTPNGKATVERAILTLKAKISRRLKKLGGYVRRPTSSPKAAQAYRRARKQAALSLAQIYRVVIEEVLDYNRSPHKTVEKYPELAAAGINPVPQDAYLYGIEHISGNTPALSDEDLRPLLLYVDRGTGIARSVNYEGHFYRPANAVALKISSRWAKQGVDLKLHVDELAREVKVWTRAGWAVFRLDKADADRLGTRTLEEDALLRPGVHGRARVSAHRALLKRLERDESNPRAQRRRSAPTRPDKAQKQALRVRDSGDLKRNLTAPITNRAQPPTQAPQSARELAAQREAARVLKQTRQIRRHAGVL